MQFLKVDDLTTHSFERFIDESSADFVQARDHSEAQNIALMKSKLNDRYDVEAIFNKTGTDRNPVIVRILSFLVIHDIISRNKARKIPEDISENYKWALQYLEEIRNRMASPDGLPVLTDEQGNPKRSAIWGNNSNENFYL